jgi:hypothetical protein
MTAKLWCFEEGEEVEYHAHPEQEALVLCHRGDVLGEDRPVRRDRNVRGPPVISGGPLRGSFTASDTPGPTGASVSRLAPGGLKEPGSTNPHTLIDAEIDAAVEE